MSEKLKKKKTDDPFYSIIFPININENQQKIIDKIPKNEQENFVPVQCGYDNYYVSDQGRLWNNNTKNFIKGTEENENFRVELTKDKKTKSIFIHRLVAHHFIPNPQKTTKLIRLENNNDNTAKMLQWLPKKKRKSVKKQIISPDQINHEDVISKIPKKYDTEIYVQMIKKDGSKYDYYYISNKGNIWYSKMNRYVLGSVVRSGYVKVHIDDEHFYLHKLVLQHFSENPENKKEGNHLGSKQENSIDKLENVTHQENMIHAAKHKIKYKTKSVQKIDKETLKVIEEFPSMKDARLKGYYRSGINNAIKNGKKYKGYLWALTNKKEPEIIIENEKSVINSLKTQKEIYDDYCWWFFTIGIVCGIS